MKSDLQQAARKALRDIELIQNSPEAKALALMNMPKVRFRIVVMLTEFECNALFGERRDGQDRELIEIEVTTPKLTGKITYNKRG